MSNENEDKEHITKKTEISDDEIKEEAVPFLIYDSNTKVFTLTEKGEEIIKTFKNEFGVISVAGMYRTGKSYLINRMLLFKQKGFSVGPTVNPCTKGLWIWSKPIYGDNGKGKRLPILLIDTEGFGALDTDSNHDIRIFTLAILLSSYFLYNSVGGIDESALQNLNFVINLSKFIQLKTGEEETDPEELSNLFPSFLWVLRDFGLQLIDEDGENITPKEYLEKVLEGTKSINDPKNKIRKLIKAYFKDRDCFTMVRPLMNENELQSLEDLPPEKLRPEFLEQITNLRKKVLGRIKPKTMNGKLLNGEMYLNLIKNLIAALNSGKVPNIESTWLSMCKVECYKAFEEAELLYENLLKENLENSDDPLEEIHKEAKTKALEIFKSKSLGEAANEYLKNLKDKIKEKYSYYQKLQDEENKGKILRVLNKWNSILEGRIQGNEFKNIDEINSDFVTLEEKLEETFSNYNGRNELFNEFKTKVFAFAGKYFADKAENERKFLEEQNEQKLKKLTSDLENAKANYDKENEKKQIILNQNKTQINDLQEELNHIKENLAVSEKEKEISTTNFNNQITRLREDYERKINDIEAKKNDNEEKQKVAERKAIRIKAESDKEKALLNQKIEHLTKQIDDAAQREKEIKQDMNSQLKEQSIAYKDKVDKYEKNTKALTSENETLKEKIVDLESNVENLESTLQNEKAKNEDYVEKTNKEIADLNENLTKLKKTSSEDKVKYSNELTTKTNELTSQINALKLKVEEAEVKLKNSEESSRAKIVKLERELAILKQENTLLKSQNEELNKRLNEQKSYYENIIQNLETKAFQVDHAEFQKKIDEVKAYYEEEKKKSEDLFEKDKTKMQQQNDKLTDSLNKSQIDLKNTKDELEHLKSDTALQIKKLTKENQDMLAEKEKLNNNMKKDSEKLNQKYKNSLEDMEKKLEEKEASHQNEIIQLNKTSEETLAQLKSLFENEKLRLEEKLKEEKSKNEKKVANLIEDYETKIKEIESDLKDENEKLQCDLEDLDQGHQTYVTNAEHEVEMLNQKTSNLEAALKEAKDNLALESAKSKETVDNLTEQFNKERKELQGKCDNLNNDLNNKEKQYTALQSKKEQMEKIILDKDNLMNSMKEEHAKDKEELNTKLEELKKKYNEVSDASMMKNLEYTRDNALLNQQIEYLNKKNEETTKVIEGNQKRYEERLFALRNEVEKDLNEKFERIKKEKEDLEGKLLAKKKEVKEVEQTFLKQQQTSEKEKNEINDKFVKLQQKYNELNDQYNTDKDTKDKQISALTKENSAFKSNLNSSEQSMKEKIGELENLLANKTSQYEKDQILWEGKIKFIEQQRDNLKKEQNDSSKRFENMLDTIQKKSNNEKESMENNYKATISGLEQKYQKQIKDLQENNSKLCQGLLERNKELEQEIKDLRMENDLNKTKNSNLSNSELTKKLEDLTNEKDKLKKNEDLYKEEQDKKLSVMQAGFEKEKDGYKKKIADIEKNLREAEGKRGALLLELEKEKAKWNIEKDNLQTKYSELNEKLVRVEKKNENLLRENEKLKNERNTLRKEKLKNNDSRYSIYFREGASILEGKSGIGNTSKLGYKNQMFKVLGDVNLGDDKGNVDTSTIGTDSNNKSKISGIDRKEDDK